MTSKKNLSTIWEIFLDFFFPQYCLVCGEKGELVCGECASRLPSAELRCIVCSRKNPLGLTCRLCRKKYTPKIALSIFAYQSLAKDLVHFFKYDDVTALSDFFASEASKLIKNIPNFENYFIQPIPISKRKKRIRGYNQSLLIAKGCSNKLKVPLTDSLTRVEAISSQVSQERKIDRAHNVKNAFMLKNKPPEKVILLDDVITSGATMREAAKVLLRSGTKEIICISIAH